MDCASGGLGGIGGGLGMTAPSDFLASPAVDDGGSLKVAYEPRVYFLTPFNFF